MAQTAPIDKTSNFQVKEMKIAYVILAFKNPEQILRLIESLNTPDTFFYIHIDKNIDINNFEKVINKIKDEKIKFSNKRFYTNWASFGAVEATLSIFEEIINDKSNNIEYVVTLTGQDYPIKNNDFIKFFLENNKNKIFMTFSRLPYFNWKNGGMDRVEAYHFNFFKNRILIKILHKVLSLLKIILPSKKINLNYHYYGGEAHFGFPIKIVEYIIYFTKNNTNHQSFFKHTFSSDELFFQTILLNSEYKNTVENKTLKYIDWNKSNVSSPVFLKTEDFNKLKDSNKLFARKFDQNVDKNILDIIDQKLR